MSKDIATLHNEVAYFEHTLANYRKDHATMRRFIGELLHPEGYGHAVNAEIRQKASEILRGIKA